MRPTAVIGDPTLDPVDAVNRLGAGEGAAFCLEGPVSAAVLRRWEVAATGGVAHVAIVAPVARGVPFGALIRALGPLLGGRADDDPLFTGAGHRVRALVTGTPLPIQGDRLAPLTHAWAWICSDLARAQPLMLLAPHAERLDRATFGALAAIARRCRDAPLALVAGVADGPRAEELRVALEVAGAQRYVVPRDHASSSHPDRAAAASIGGVASADGPAPVGSASEDSGHGALVPTALRLAAATPSGDARLAERFADAAAQADALGAPELAIVLWRRALAERADAPPRHRLLVDLGQALDRAGDGGADELLSEAANAARDDAERGEAVVARAAGMAARGEPAAAVSLLVDARSGCRDSQTRALLDAEYARIGRVVLPERTAALEVAERLLSSERPRSSAERRLFAEMALEAVSGAEPGRRVVVARATAALDGGRLLAEETADGLGWFWSAYALHLAEENRAAFSVLDDAVAEAQQRGSLAGFVQAIALRSGPRFHLGDLREAAADCELALAAGAGAHEAWLPAVRSSLMQLRAAMGDLEGAQRVAAEQELAHAATGPTMLFRYGRAVMEATAGDSDAALAQLSAAGEEMALGVGTNPAMMPWRALTARLLATRDAGDDRARARTLADEELELARRFGARGTIAIAEHAVAWAGEPELRIERLRGAVATHADGERACEQIETLIDLGRELHAAGYPHDARDPLREALHLSHERGAGGLAERARSALVAAGGRPRRPAMRGTAALTPSELRVARIAVDGASNREIAEQLFVTVKTVEWHLHGAYRKLGVAGRRELEAALGRRPGG